MSKLAISKEEVSHWNSSSNSSEGSGYCEFNSKETMCTAISSSTSLGGGTSSNLTTYINLICLMTVGCPPNIAMIFSMSGWIAVLLIFVIAVAVWYTGILLIQCIYYKPGSRISSYPEIAQAAFGRTGRIIIQIGHNLILLGISALFILFSGGNLKMVFDSAKITSDVITEKNLIVMAGVLVLIPYLFAKSTQELKIITLFGMFSSVTTVIIATYLGLLDIDNARMVQVHHDVALWNSVPTALATTGFMFGGNVVFTHVEGGMAKPKDWPKILALALATLCALYITVGVSGYYVYGDRVIRPIMFYLPDGTTRSILLVMVALHLILTTPFLLMAFSVELEGSLKPHLNRPLALASRALIASLVTLLAANVPHFAALVTFIGAMGNLLIVFVAPVVLNLRLLGWRNRSWTTYLAMAGCVVLGWVSGVMGIYSAIIEMEQSIKEGTNKS